MMLSRGISGSAWGLTYAGANEPGWREQHPGLDHRSPNWLICRSCRRGQCLLGEVGAWGALKSLHQDKPLQNAPPLQGQKGKTHQAHMGGAGKPWRMFVTVRSVVTNKGLIGAPAREGTTVTAGKEQRRGAERGR